MKRTIEVGELVEVQFIAPLQALHVLSSIFIIAPANPRTISHNSPSLRDTSHTTQKCLQLSSFLYITHLIIDKAYNEGIVSYGYEGTGTGGG